MHTTPSAVNSTNVNPTVTTTLTPPENHTNEIPSDLYGWGEDDTPEPPTNTTTTTTTTTTAPIPNSSSPTSLQQQQFTLHNTFDSTNIPPSILTNNTTTPTKDEPEPVVQESLTHETPFGLYYFYQVQDGQTAFLHPLCVRVLIHEYQTFERLPSVLRGTIIDLEEVVQTEKTRKQFRHLAHLPLTCMFQLVYIDVTPLVSSRTINHFAEDLRKLKQVKDRRVKAERQKKWTQEREEREEKEREHERRRERQAEMELMRESFTPLSLATATPPVASSSSISSSSIPATQEAPSESNEIEEKKEEEKDEEEEESGVSFAQALMGAQPKRRKPKKASGNNTSSSSKKNKKNQILLFSNAGSRGHY